MLKQCEYCKNFFDDTLAKCPNCGATNNNIARMSNEQPRTIEELKQWYVIHNLPPEHITRFFIGKDIREPKAFGIYQDAYTGNFIVYKNKSNGQRAIRYEGKDEAYAVNELYQRLRAEITNQKTLNRNKKVSKASEINSEDKWFVILLKASIIGFCFAPIFGLYPLIPFFGVFISAIVFMADEKRKKYNKYFVLLILIITPILSIHNFLTTPTNGYYRYNDNVYYYQRGDWYINDGYDNWEKVDEDISELDNNFRDYKDSDNTSGHTFKDSIYYHSSDDGDWDNDSSWDSNDSWDSGGSDWDSDW